MKNKILPFALLGIFTFLTINSLSGIDKKKVPISAPVNANTVYNVLDFGAKGDGKTLDSPSINKAIEEAAD